MQFIDSHSHLNSDAFDEDRDEVIARMKAAGMAAAMVIACEDDELPKLEALLAALRRLGASSRISRQARAHRRADRRDLFAPGVRRRGRDGARLLLVQGAA